MSTKQKLELNWIGKHKRPRLEPRILLEDKDLSYGDADSENLLIHGDNLLALKSLEQQYAGKIKCIFIDPPYNTGSAFSHYDDGLEHSMWLSMMRDRLELLRSLLSEEGSLWITIDDNEAHYLKVLCDEVFGRANFVANIVWQKKYSKQNDSKWFSTSHDHIFVYAKNKNKWFPNKLERSSDELKGYKNPDNDSRGLWQSVVYTCAKPDLKGLIYITQSLILKQVKKYTQVNPVFGHMTEKGMNNILLMVYCGGAKIMTKINLD